MFDVSAVLRPPRVRALLFALGLVGLVGLACSSCSSSEPEAKAPEAIHEQAVSQSSTAFASSTTVMRTLQDALGALDRRECAAWDRILETGLVPALDKAIADWEMLRETEKALSNAAQPPLGTSAPLTLKPRIEPLTLLGGALAIDLERACRLIALQPLHIHLYQNEALLPDRRRAAPVATFTSSSLRELPAWSGVRPGSTGSAARGRREQPLRRRQGQIAGRPLSSNIPSKRIDVR